MPNIIVELTREISRVTGLLPALDPATRAKAEKAIRFAKEYMALNSYEQMQDWLDELREVKPAK